MTVVTVLILVIVSIVFGVLAALGYMVWRMLRSEGWDTSNMTNALRLISHTVLHAEDFTKMYYLDKDALDILTESGVTPRKPFWYIDKDELSEVVETRPDYKEMK